MDHALDDIDRELLNKIQSGFPINERPYGVIANELGITEEETILRLKGMKEKGIIRKIGCIFEYTKLGYKSILCALNVDEDRVKEVARIINSYKGVTHNYIRDHEYNMWFTLIAPSEDDLSRTLDEIEIMVNSGKLIRMRSKRVFKIKVNFNMKQGINA